MLLKQIKPILPTIGISAITSILFSTVAFFLYFHTTAPTLKETLKKPGFSLSATGSPKTLAQDTQFAKYETIINDFLDSIRKGEIETAYKSTSPIFQKKTSLADFKKLLNNFQSPHNLPSACSLTQYSEPFSSSINGLPNEYMIVQTKCEVTENNQINGLNVEFIDDAGKSKISYFSVYTSPVVHQKEKQTE